MYVFFKSIYVKIVATKICDFLGKEQCPEKLGVWDTIIGSLFIEEHVTDELSFLEEIIDLFITSSLKNLQQEYLIHFQQDSCDITFFQFDED